MYAGASSPRADVVSFASLSEPRLKIAFLLASARAVADIVAWVVALEMLVVARS